MEWSLLSALLWFYLCIYVPYAYVGLSWEFMVLFGFCWCTITWKRMDSVRTWPVWNWLRSRHEIEYKGRTDLLEDRTKARLFSFHPHGTHCISAILTQARPDLVNLRVAVASVLFWIPIVNMFVGWGNCLPATRYGMLDALRTGTSLVVYPGGLNEVPGAYFLRDPPEPLPSEKERLYTYNNRVGFIGVAQEAGVPVVPVWVEGEYDTYKVWFPFPRLSRLMYRVIGFPFPIVSSGHYGTFLPKPVKLVVHVGEPIDTTQRGATIEYLKERHDKELERLKTM